MSLKTIKNIKNINCIILNKLKSKSIGGFSNYNPPNETENIFFRREISPQIIKKLWNNQIKNVKKYNILIPRQFATDLLLVSKQIVEGTNYRGIISVLFIDINCNQEITKYYKIEYFKPLVPPA